MNENYLISRRSFYSARKSALIISALVMGIMFIMAIISSISISDTVYNDLKIPLLVACLLLMITLSFVTIRYSWKSSEADANNMSFEECFGISAEDEVDDPRDYCFTMLMVRMINSMTVGIDVAITNSKIGQPKRKELALDLNNEEAARNLYDNLMGIIIKTSLRTTAKFYLDRKQRKMFLDYTSGDRENESRCTEIINLRTGGSSPIQII
jgi:hypothetical protein